MTKSNLLKNGAVLAASLFVGTTAMAQTVVYDNSTTSFNKILSLANGVEAGDQVRVAGTSVGPRRMTDFSFEYFLSPNANANESVTLAVRKLDGPIVQGNIVSPGTLLYSSGSVNISPGYHTFQAFGLNTEIPDDVVWSVKFNGIDAGETAGILYYSPPTVGSSTDDFWQFSNGAWSLQITPDVPDNFAARIVAVPEPGTLALMLGGLAGAGLLAYRRKS
jgi:hypothetical protein